MLTTLYGEQSWESLLGSFFSSHKGKELDSFIKNEYQTSTVYPRKENIFRALSLCPKETVRVVILGQDPYHGEGQATGLAFSVPEHAKTPPSLQNILKELQNDIGNAQIPSPDLSRWAKQGVLLLNTTLTVRCGEPGSHKNKGWEMMTDSIISDLSKTRDHLVFILWGSDAIKKENLIDAKKHLIITSPHPSPLSAYRGFFGSKPFSKTNTYLRTHKKKEIDWS